MVINELYSKTLEIFSFVNIVFIGVLAKKMGLRKESSRYYFLLSIAITIYAYGYSQEILYDDFENIEKWLKIEYLGGAFVPSLWFIIISEISGHMKNFNNKIKGVLIFFGFFILVVFYTNSYHKLYYVSKGLIFYKGFALIETQKGTLYAIFVLYELMALFYAFYISVSKLYKENSHLRNRYFLIFCASICLAGAFFLNITGWGKYKFDYLPIASIIFQILLGFSIFKYGLINYVPIAYEFVIKNMKEGLLVVDKERRIVNYNDSFVKLVGLKSNYLGKAMEKMELYNLGFDEFFSNKLDYNIDKKPFYLTLNNEYYKINYTLVGENSYGYAWVFLFYNITREQEYLKQVEYFATYDTLTGLFNRRAFFEKFSEQCKKNEKAAIISFDFDYFKEINDNYSHSAGDFVLKYYGKLIDSFAKDRDGFAGRIGGEEFIVFLPRHTLWEAKLAAEELRVIFENQRLNYEKDILIMTGSFGVTQKRENECDEAFIKRGDKALYQAKELGRNRVEVTI